MFKLILFFENSFFESFSKNMKLYKEYLKKNENRIIFPKN